MKSILIGLLAPALLSVAAASQTIVVPRTLPFTGVPRVLPNPVTGLPLSPARLPSPLVMPEARLTAAIPALAPRPELAVAAPAYPVAFGAPSDSPLPALRVDAERELPFEVRLLLPMKTRLEEAVKAPEKKTKKAEKTAPHLAYLFDGRSLTLPEDDLEKELGLR